MAATTLRAKPRRVERGSRLVQELDGPVRQETGIVMKLTAEPK